MKNKFAYVLLGGLLMLTACGGDKKENNTTTDSNGNFSEQTQDIKQNLKTEAEANAQEFPAKPGAVLVTKGDFKFTGKKYYFKGTFVDYGAPEIFTEDNTWLVKNENGYVMPITMKPDMQANVGDEVEVWGTLTGEGFQTIPGIDNVVGQTGQMIMMICNVNGEEVFYITQK